MKTTYILSIIAAVAVFGASPVFAATGATYTTHSPYAYGPSRNNYNAKGGTYGPSKDNYNGHQSYGSAPKTGSPVDTYSSSKQALSSSVAY